jgi:hypothetical protein
MRPFHLRPFQRLIRFGLAGLFMVLAVVEVAWTQAMSPIPAPENGLGHGLFAFVFLVALLALTLITAKLHYMKRRREDQAVALQARLFDVLFTEPLIAHFPIMLTVRVPFVRYPQAEIMLTGIVPTPALREAVLRLVHREVASLVDTYRIEDCLVVDTEMLRRAA